nr:MAG TPA: hypothetical protein [Caudoviricetes sp.]
MVLRCCRVPLLCLNYTMIKDQMQKNIDFYV